SQPHRRPGSEHPRDPQSLQRLAANCCFRCSRHRNHQNGVLIYLERADGQFHTRSSRKFEDLLTLTPGVAITQGPDGDEINFNGQRGVFNNISLDGGDYNNGFFGEQEGGQRAAIDITLDAVKEFQVVASGANAEFGRTAGGVVNVITKSGTNEIHGSAFEYFRTESLSANTSDGKPLQDFRRNQFGGS